MTWQDFDNGLAFIGIKFSLLVSSAIGAVVSVRKKKRMNWWQKTTAVAIGIASASFLTPLIMEFVRIGEKAEYGISYVIGYMGMESVELLIKNVKEKREKIKINGTD
jgi:hypothetical protein